MPSAVVYAFEELGEDLPRPPLAALRALLLSGVVISPNGWRALSREAKHGLATHGSLDTITPEVVRSLLRGAPLGEMKLVRATSEPRPDVPPPGLARAFGPGRTVGPIEWQSFRPIDRFVLSALQSNSRLVCRALEEISRYAGREMRIDAPWIGPVARAEVQIRRDAVLRLSSNDFLDGRGLVLARASGLRAGRRTCDVFDLHAHDDMGVIEIDWLVSIDSGVVLWQAHASSWEGIFSPVGSLAAVTTAAIAIIDMLRADDPNAKLLYAGVQEESWRVGSQLFQDDATIAY
jgi:molybdenum cofactor biosynthesis enzyme